MSVSDDHAQGITRQLTATDLGDASDKPLSKKALAKLRKETEKNRRKAESGNLHAQQNPNSAQPDYSPNNYGILEINQSTCRTDLSRVIIKDIASSDEGKRISLRARVHNSRAQGNKLCFFRLRQQFDTIQAVLTVTPELVSKQMVKFATCITAESLVLIEATIVRAPELVQSCTIQEFELRVHTIFVESAAPERLPFTIEDASRPETDFDESSEIKYARVNLDTRLNNRIIDLRTQTNQAIFRIQSGVCQLFREFLYSRGFNEIHTPKLLGAASEGGASVFEVTYFKSKAYLSQSPQLHKQMMICADFDRVFEIGPVFRAENANTHRHLTEFTGLDLEMTFNEHYHEVLDLFDELFVFLFDGLQTRYSREIKIVQSQYPFEDFKYLNKSLRLTYPEAVAMLRECGVEIADEEDLNTEKERLLGKLVKEKFGTDFFMLDKFPLAIRPFYTMPNPSDPVYSNSYDFFIRGEEILSGAQRVHDSSLLEKRARENGVDPVSIKGYLDAFKYGVAPHAGGGIGLERVVMLYLNLYNIRRTSLFPRDPSRIAP